MAKSSGIGQRYYHHGYDLSGDAGSASRVSHSRGLLDVTAINEAGHERIHGRRDGEISFQSWFNTGTTLGSEGEHVVLSAMPTTDIHLFWMTGVVIGDPVAFMVAKQVNYDGTEGADGSLSFAVQNLANGYGLFWGAAYTAGKITIASAAAQTAIDGGTTAAAKTITGGSAASPTVVTTSTPHGYVTGDSVLHAGCSEAALNGNFTVTMTGASTYTVPVDLSGGASTGGTSTKTSTNFGMSADLQQFGDAGSGSAVPAMQDSADNSTFADITGLVFSNVTGAGNVHQGEFKQTATTAIIRRYTRFNTTGTFTNAPVAVAAKRHLVSTI